MRRRPDCEYPRRFAVSPVAFPVRRREPGKSESVPAYSIEYPPVHETQAAPRETPFLRTVPTRVSSQEEGRTVLVVSHNMATIEALCHKTIFLKNGTIENFSKTDEVVRQYLVQNNFYLQPCVDLRIHPGRKTSHPPIFQQIRMLDQYGNETVSFLCGDHLVVDIIIDTSQFNLSNPRIGFAINNDHGQRIC